MVSNLPRYFRTLRHLRAKQLGAQVWNRLRGAVERPERWNPGAVPVLPNWRAGDLTGLTAPTPGPEAGQIRAGRFRFAGEEQVAGWPPDWRSDGATKLWQYNLHYHDWLWGLLDDGDWDCALRGVVDWIDHHPLRRGAVGWDPYPISLRLQNWIVLLFLRHGERMRAAGLAEKIWASVWKQALRLEARLEVHLLGNHLFENAVSLCLLGAVFEGEDGARWRRKGMALLRREIEEQILSDGMHLELSPMYHQRVTWLLELLSRVGDEELTEMVGESLSRARDAQRCLRHPDGRISLFNDSSVGIYSDQAGGSEEMGAWSLPAAGYYGYRSKKGDYIICDAGKIGPDYQPGHAHADCLAFELSLRGRRVITDTGVSDYRVSQTRAYVRSTAAHNTVEIEGEDQSEMWGAFRVGARGYPRDVSWESREDGFRLGAGHDGYQRLGAGVAHHRTFEWSGEKLRVRDKVEGARSFVAVARLHFGPECLVEIEEEALVVKFEEGELRIRIEGEGVLSLGDSPYYERFGERVARRMLVYRVEVRGAARWEMVLDWCEAT